MSASRPTAVTPTPPSAETGREGRGDERPATVAVAYSGGRDSTALLHATLTQAAAAELHVLALHIHHGLSPQADAWLAHCEAQCLQWARDGLAVEFVAHRLSTRPAPGQSVEAWAREARYAALARLALGRGAQVVLLAHHRRDQAETFLLQALRGGGVAALAAMPERIDRLGVTWLRPWLQRPREDIDAYVARQGLAHIEDDTNQDPRFARNRLRLAVWPALGEAFGLAEAALARSARWAQEADAALAELALIDLGAVASEDGLVVANWLALSPARRSLALRAWVQRESGRSPAASLTSRLLAELPVSGSARWLGPCGELRLHRGVLRLASLPAGARPVARRSVETQLCVRRAGSYALPGWGGRLEIRRVRSGGVPFAWLARLDLRRRAGGERFQAGPGRPPRSLKKQFQHAGVAAWDRLGPLVYSGGLLVYVPGLGLDARVIAPAGQPSATVRWVPEPPEDGLLDR